MKGEKEVDKVEKEKEEEEKGKEQVERSKGEKKIYGLVEKEAENEQNLDKKGERLKGRKIGWKNKKSCAGRERRWKGIWEERTGRKKEKETNEVEEWMKNEKAPGW